MTAAISLHTTYKVRKTKLWVFKPLAKRLSVPCSHIVLEYIAEGMTEHVTLN